MNQLLTIAADLVAIAVLAFGVYFPRHHRRDLVVAFTGVNIGVLAVSTVLGSSTVGLGLGLGLFGARCWPRTSACCSRFRRSPAR